MNSVLNSVIKKTAYELGVSDKLVKAIYKSYWLFIKTQITSNNLKNISYEEFEAVNTNFNIPYIGKLYVKYDKVEKHKRQLKFYRDVKYKKN